MHSFTDTKGRTWEVAIHIGAVKRVRDLLGENILDVEDAGDQDKRLLALDRITTDRIHVVDIIYVLVKPQADKLGVTDEEFGASLAGQPLADAQRAYLEELVCFFTDPYLREIVRAVIARHETVTEERRGAMKLVAQKIADGSLDVMLGLTKPPNLPTPGNGSMSSPASAESAPTISPGGN